MYLGFFFLMWAFVAINPCYGLCLGVPEAPCSHGGELPDCVMTHGPVLGFGCGLHTTEGAESALKAPPCLLWCFAVRSQERMVLDVLELVS